MFGTQRLKKEVMELIERGSLSMGEIKFEFNDNFDMWNVTWQEAGRNKVVLEGLLDESSKEDIEAIIKPKESYKSGTHNGCIIDENFHNRIEISSMEQLVSLYLRGELDLCGDDNHIIQGEILACARREIAPLKRRKTEAILWEIEFIESHRKKGAANWYLEQAELALERNEPEMHRYAICRFIYEDLIDDMYGGAR